MQDLFQAIDGMPASDQHWLFPVLLVLTFFLHTLFMNLTLGGTLLAAIAQLLSDGRPGDYRGHFARRLMAINTYGIGMTIATGIAPLMFVRALYSESFADGSLLIAWAWIFMLVLLVIGYYAAYLFKVQSSSAGGEGGTGWLLVAALMFLFIAMVHVAIHLSHSQPTTWQSFMENPWVILKNPLYLPRLAHFVLAAVAFSGLVAAWWATREIRVRRSVKLNRSIARFAWRSALWATLVLIVDGFILMGLLPRSVIAGLVRGGAVTQLPLTGAILLGLGLLVILARDPDPTERGGLVTAATLGSLVTIAVMSITRQQVRELQLQPLLSRSEIGSTLQSGGLLLFGLLLLAALATVSFTLHQALSHRTRGPGAV